MILTRRRSCPWRLSIRLRGLRCLDHYRSLCLVRHFYHGLNEYMFSLNKHRQVVFASLSTTGLSPFAIAIEPLAIRIRHHKDITGLEVGGSEALISLYADDVILYLNSGNSVPVLLELITSFGRLSGLIKLNFAEFLSKLKGIIENWKVLPLSMIGRINSLKVVSLPRFLYISQNTPTFLTLAFFKGTRFYHFVLCLEL